MLDIMTHTPIVNSGEPPRVRGRGLAHRKMSGWQRAALAADLLTGRVRLEPSLTQVCEIVGVSSATVRAELKSRVARKQPPKNDPAANLVAAWDAASPSEREVAIRDLGAATVWDVLAKIVA
jgi:hypothetical protein